MKSTLKRTTLLLTGVLVGGKLFAQTPDSSSMPKDYVKPFSTNSAFRTWSIGINGGVLTPFTIFGSNSKQDFTSPNAKIGYGGYIKDQILPSFGIQADFFAGKLSGDHSQPDANGNVPYDGFNTKLNYSASLSGNFTLANINWRHKKGAIQPYLTAGAGLINYSPVLNITGGGTQNLNAGTNVTHSVFVPVGAGLKFDVAPGINLDLGYTVNFVYADDVDGYVFGNTNDRFSYAHIGLEFALGKRSKPQLATHNPVSSMRDEYLWENRNTRNQLQSQIDLEKAQNAQLQNELNTTNANLARFTTDSDGDGVPDIFDKCPNTPVGVKVDGSGCPLPVVQPAETKVYITEEDKRVVNEAVKDLEFDFGKATIREHSFPSLDQLAQLLINKKFNLKLAGYTDNVGSVKANLKLSRDRAEAIKTYLVSKGADGSLIHAEGYGKSNPIATNKTADGRQQNRRVEFSLY